MYKLRSKLNFLFHNIPFNTFKPQQFKTKIAHKLTLISASMFLLPKYVFMKNQQNTNSSQQTQQQNIQQKDNNNKSNQQHQQHKQDQIINFITSYEDAQKLNLHGNILIWYQTTGEDYIDEEVIILLRKFVNERYHSISCPFKIIIDKTPRSKQIDQSSKYYKKPVQLVIIRPQQLKPISLSRHLSYQRTSDLHYYTLFQRLTTQLNQFKQINITNMHQFAQNLGNRSYQACIIMNAPHEKMKMKKAKKNFKQFVDDKATFAANTNKVIVTDQFASRYLGLPQYKLQGDNIYVVIPDSQNVANPGITSIIHNQKYHIYQPYMINNSLVIAPYLQKSSPDSLIMKIHADLNQNIHTSLSQLYQNLRKSDKYPELSSIPKILLFHSLKQKDSKPIQITIQKNNFDQIVNVYSPECRYSNKQKKQLLYEGNKWKFQEQQISAQVLEKWVNDVVNHKVQPFFDDQKLQNTKVKKYNSTRITGQQYHDILQMQRNKPKIVLHYSQHCFSCKKFSPVYQQIAGQKQDKYNFYRIDNDFNRTKGLRNFNSTPIFVIYKNGHTFIYKNNIFTKRLFQDFLDITNDFKTMNQQIIQKSVADRKQNQFKLSDLA